MAVPFNLPNNEISDELIIEQLYRLLAALQHNIQVTRRTDASSQTSARVRTAPSASARRSRDEERTVPTNRDPLPDLVTSLRHLAPSAMPTVHHTITGIISRADDSTCCEGDGNEIIKVDISNSHFGFVVLESRIQNDERFRRQNSGQSGGPEGLISKLVHGPMSGPIWTAVMCMVGWHLLRTR